MGTISHFSAATPSAGLVIEHPERKRRTASGFVI
jgi:hypothetical protein